MTSKSTVQYSTVQYNTVQYNTSVNIQLLIKVISPNTYREYMRHTYMECCIVETSANIMSFIRTIKIYFQYNIVIMK